jgi:hypothetical protein
MRKLLMVSAAASFVLASCGQVEDQGLDSASEGRVGGSNTVSTDAGSSSGGSTPGTADAADSAPAPGKDELSVLISGRDGGTFRVTFPVGWLDGQRDGSDHRFLRPGETKDILGSVAMVSVFKNAPEFFPDLIGTDARTQEGRTVKVYDDSQEGFPPVTLLHVEMGDFIVGLAVTNSSTAIVDELLAGFRLEEAK